MGIVLKHSETHRILFYLKGAEVVMGNKVRPNQRATGTHKRTSAASSVNQAKDFLIWYWAEKRHSTISKSISQSRLDCIKETIHVASWWHGDYFSECQKHKEQKYNSFRLKLVDRPH
jgi:hypothetical protein